MLQLNNPRIEITSPLYRYCGMVAATSGGAGIVASNPGLRNLFTELNKRVRTAYSTKIFFFAYILC